MGNTPSRDRDARWWRREGSPKRFRYVEAGGSPVARERDLARIQSLRIPPAWREVRINPSPRAKVQAVGLDAKGRRQYLYHIEWVKGQSEAKYARLARFVERLPHFRGVTTAHLKAEGLGKEKVLALVTRLINEGCFRIGGERYAKENQHFGIATLQCRHVTVTETCLRFRYLGKKGVQHAKVIPDPELVALMRQLKALPGGRLFRYHQADGTLGTITSRDVNAYIKAIMGPEFSAKDFRTWGGTLMAARILAAYGPAESETQRKQRERATVRAVARYLGNTPAIARASYISPIVLTLYAQGLTLCDLAPRRRQQIRLEQQGYSLEEVELMKMLSLPTDPTLSVTFAPEAPTTAAS